MERVPPVESKIGGTGWTEGGEGSPERRARAGDRIEHNTTTGGLESGRETCGSVELRGVRRCYFPCLRLWLRGIEGRPPILLSMFTSHDSSRIQAPHRCVVFRRCRRARPSARGTSECHAILLRASADFTFHWRKKCHRFLFFSGSRNEGGTEGKAREGRNKRKEGRKEGRTLDLFDPKRPLPFWRTSASLSDPRNAFPSHLLFLSAWSRSVTQPWGSI